MKFTWWSLVSDTTLVSGVTCDQVGTQHTIVYQDGSQWTVRLVELSDLETSLSYEVVSSADPLPVSSAVHTLRLRRVTASNETYVEWVSDFSSDATTAVVEDSRFKKLEAFKDLAAAAAAAK